MILKITWKPEDVISQEDGELLLRVRPGNPSLPLWLATANGKTEDEFYDGDNPAKDGRYLNVSEGGTISVGPACSWSTAQEEGE